MIVNAVFLLLFLDISFSFVLQSAHAFVTNAFTTTKSRLCVAANKNGTTFESYSFNPSFSTYNTPHVRWLSVNTYTWELQTAVTRWQHSQYEQCACELHAMVHYGALDYYQYYNTLSNTSATVLFELLSDREQFNAQGQLVQSVQATQYDRAYVQQYNQQQQKQHNRHLKYYSNLMMSDRHEMHCQVDVLQYQQSHWYHADWTRQELEAYLTSQSTQSKSYQLNQQQPLWQRTQSQTWTNVAQAALVQGGPPLSSLVSQERRLFTHLFWPGGSLAGLLRTLLWCTVPSPELSILLFDTSTLFPRSSSSSSSSSSASRLGWTSLPIVQILLSGQWFQIKWLLMGQELVQQQQQQQQTATNKSRFHKNEPPTKDWIQQRNEKTMTVLQKKLEQRMSRCRDEHDNSSAHTFALLYGCQHMHDLQQQLVKQGWQHESTQWRTAWTIHVAQSSVLPQYAAAIFASMTYLSIGALDWLDVWTNDVSWTALALYVARHVLLYVGLSRLFLDWTTES